MKTLKKTLCMVLAVVMVVGVLILPASADDAADKAKAQEADYKTLTTYGIMHGRDGGAEALDEYVRRDEVATIVYRILTGDTSEDGKMAGNFKAAAKNFTDVATTNWAAGFIGYTAESKIFSGRAGNKFDPTANVRGDELVKVMLRCLGYGEEGEYTGEGWNTRALYTAQEIGMLKDIDEEMDQPITRGAVSQIVLNAIELPMAVYYNGTYSNYRDASGRPVAPNTPGALSNPKLVAYNEGRSAMKFDIWGAPYYECKPTVTFNHVYNAEPIELDKYIEQVEPMGEYFVATTECDIAYDGNLTGETTLDTFTNGAGNKSTQDIQPTDTVGKVGAQGQWIRTFDTKDSDNKSVIDRIVYVDTLLAQVTKVIKEEKDANGHIKTEAALQLHVYNVYDEAGATNPTSIVETMNYTIAGNDYNKGDFILLRAVAKADGTLAGNTAADGSDNYEVLDLAPSFTGKQTTIWYNQDSHVIDGKTYPDNNRYTLDVAQNDGGTYVWFTDGHGNVIGSIKPETAPSSYAVLTGMIWVNGNPGHAEVSLLYMDGTTATAPLNKIALGANGQVFSETSSEQNWTTQEGTASAADGTHAAIEVNGGVAYVSDEGGNNTMFRGYALYEVTTSSNGAVTLKQTKFLTDNDSQLKNKGTVITATTYDSTSIGTLRVYVDDSTVFIVRGVDATGKVVYDRYVGKDNVPSFDDNGLTLFYADIKNNDRVAEYVYVNAGTETSAAPNHLVAALSNTYSNHLIDGKQNYALNSAFVGDQIVPSGTIYSRSSEDPIKTLADNYNQLYWVSYSGAEVNSVTAINKTGVRVYTGAAAASGSESVYKLDKVKYTSGMLIAEYGATSSVNSWNTNNSSVKVYGKTKDDLKDIDWSKVNAYAVLAATSEDLKSLYIFDVPASATAGPGPAPAGYGEAEGATLSFTDPNHGAIDVDIREGSTNTIKALATKALEDAGYDKDSIQVVSDTVAYAKAKSGDTVTFTITSHTLYKVTVTITESNSRGVTVSYGDTQLKSGDLLYVARTAGTHTGVKVNVNVTTTGHVNISTDGSIATASPTGEQTVTTGTATEVTVTVTGTGGTLTIAGAA